MFLLVSKICCICNLTQCNHLVGEYIPVTTELKPDEERAWKAFLDAQASLMRRLEAELVAREGMTLAEFDVLIQLRLASDGRLRMTELSDRVRLSPSGLTRLVDRLVRAGLVKRGRCATDRRGTWAILTAAGIARVRQARPVHLRGVREHFSGQLSPAQLAAVAEALEPIGRDMRQPTPEPV
jgi:DNA-binding MarR family transcriptional regulator